MITKQTAFSLAKGPEERQQWDALWKKLVDAQQLEYEVLLAHVLLYEDLCRVLGLRLRTDSLPKRMPTFVDVVGFALAGNGFVEDRTTLGFLNEARNKIAHTTDRSAFEQDARTFAQRSCNDKNEEYRLDFFEWPPEEAKKIENFCIGFFVWQAKPSDLVTEFGKTNSERRQSS